MRDQISDEQIDSLRDRAQLIKTRPFEYDHDDVDLLEDLTESGQLADVYDTLSDDEREAVDTMLDDTRSW